MLHRALGGDRLGRIERTLDALLATERRRTRALEVTVLLLTAAFVWVVFFNLP